MICVFKFMEFFPNLICLYLADFCEQRFYYFSTEVLARLRSEDGLIVAEGFLFEVERRGYLKAGAFVPEVVLEHPESLRELHREFAHAGSDVVLAFTVLTFVMNK